MRLSIRAASVSDVSSPSSFLSYTRRHNDSLRSAVEYSAKKSMRCSLVGFVGDLSAVRGTMLFHTEVRRKSLTSRRTQAAILHGRFPEDPRGPFSRWRVFASRSQHRLESESQGFFVRDQFLPNVLYGGGYTTACMGRQNGHVLLGITMILPMPTNFGRSLSRPGTHAVAARLALFSGPCERTSTEPMALLRSEKNCHMELKIADLSADPVRKKGQFVFGFGILQLEIPCSSS